MRFGFGFGRRPYLVSAVSAIALTAAAVAHAAADGAETAEASAPAAGADGSDSSVDEVIVTGTRQVAQTQFSAKSPVDVFSGKMVNSVVTDRLDEALAQLVPSFTVLRLPASDGPEFIKPASLDGLSPDMTLVLVNGKRFHRSAYLDPNTGSQAPDLSMIPTFAIDHIEVLRDGASAQYGTDAIAGVINIILNEKPGFAAFAQGSQYYAGDGLTGDYGARAGFALPHDGHIVVTAEYNHANDTSRSNQRPDAIAFQAANPTINVPNPVQVWGNPEMESEKLSIDVSEPINDYVEAYGFSILSMGNGMSDINWRNPSTNADIYETTPAFPGFNLNNLYPAGFTPREGEHCNDEQIVAGVRHNGSDRFTWDVSASYGRNDTGLFLDNSINASMGPDSPTAFSLGHLIEGELDLNADAVYTLPVSFLPAPVNIAFGAERRDETYSIVAGDPASYEVGPGAVYGLAPESNGFPGYSPLEAGTWDQVSYAGYLDVNVPITKQWSVEAAGRDESYTTFGNTFNYKFATRYELTQYLALRGSYSTGFKAPTPAQLNSTDLSQGLDTTTLQLYTSGLLSPLNPVAKFLGAKPLTPEESKTLTGGFVWKSDIGLSGSVDVYRIEVDKRFGVSQIFDITPQIQQELVAAGVVGGSQVTSVDYFTNDFNTLTQGIDLVESYTHPIGPGRFDITTAFSYTGTTVTGGALAAASDEAQKIIFQDGIPAYNITGTATYTVGKVSILGRVRYYGPWTDASGDATGDIFQRFPGITFFDAAVTYNINPHLAVKVGAENLFNTYPAQATNQASRGLIYSRDSPYDTNGGNYYMRIDVKY
jgi:iron complex outermembrane receptor protein